MPRILIATGGTGGHIYPALALAEELRGRGSEVCFIGVFGPAAAKLEAGGFRAAAIRVRGFVAKSLPDKVLALREMLRALWSCGQVIKDFKPDVVVGFGGYSSFPTVLMARLLGRRALIHEQNVVPGEANRLLARIVPRVCVGFRDSLPYFPAGKALWTGTPFRRSPGPVDRATAAHSFGLDPRQKIILVFGGSQGARRINECFLEMLSRFPEARDWQVIHATGKADLEAVRARYAAERGRKYSVQAFIENIEQAYAACDVVVARAGAGTVTELGMGGIPAVIVPYPGARNHQLQNARVLERAGSAVIIEENSLSSDILGAKILAMASCHTSRRDFQETLSREFVSDPAQRLADEIGKVMTGGK